MTTQAPTMTLADFLALVNNASAWTRYQHTFCEESIEREDRDDDYKRIYVSMTTGAAAIFSSTVLSTGETVEITYQQTYAYDDFDPDSTLEIADPHPEAGGAIEIQGLTVVEIDEDGDVTEVELTDRFLDDELPIAFTRIDWSFIPDNPVTDVDTDKTEDTDMETITIQIDNAPDLRFTGELIAEASSSDNNASGSSYSGQTGRWTTLRLYRTAGGKFVCHQIGHTRWQGEQTRYSGAVCEDEAGVLKFFGYGWLAKDLYDDAGIDYATDVA